MNAAGPRILVIEDDGALLLLFAEIVRELGAEPILRTSAPTPAELKQLNPAAMLLDLRLGTTLDGWTLLQTLRSDPHLARVPVVVCTAVQQLPAQSAAVFEQPEIVVVPKPFVVEELVQALRQALGRP